MGNLHVILTALFKKMGIDYVIPPPVTARTYEIGFKLSPEQVCLPFKICIGSFVEAIEKGAKTIVMAGGNGPCRFGFYGMLQEKILNDAGYRFKMLVLDQDNISKVLNELSSVAGLNKLSVASAFVFAWKILRLSEENEKLSHYYRAHCSDKRAVDRIESQVESLLLKTTTAEQIGKLKRELKYYYSSELKADIDPREVMRIGILGEIYMMLDSEANMNINRRLGYLNVWVDKTVYLSSWLLKLTSLDYFSKTSYAAQKKTARPYITSDIGGKGVQTIASAIDYSRGGFDGLIHITPFSCMPELVATTILPKVCSDRNIACLYLTYDGHTSEAAFVTRLEAYVDMIRMGRPRAAVETRGKKGFIYA